MKRQRPTRWRKPPKDFAALAPTMTRTALAHRFGTSIRVIGRWLDDIGTEAAKQPPPPYRPRPEDFAERVSTMTRRALIKHYRTNTTVVARWIAEAGIKPVRGLRYDARPVPEDFTDLARTMYATRLAAHYSASHDMVARWARLTGVSPPKAPPGRPRPKIAKPGRTSRPAAFRTPKQAHSFDTLRRETTVDGLAADHLRRFCAVYRCTETGRADQDGAWWRYGNAVLTPAELIARAERHGFDAGAWRRLAA